MCCAYGCYRSDESDDLSVISNVQATPHTQRIHAKAQVTVGEELSIDDLLAPWKPALVVQMWCNPVPGLGRQLVGRDRGQVETPRACPMPRSPSSGAEAGHADTPESSELAPQSVSRGRA
jgi:hypothetical protein